MNFVRFRRDQGYESTNEAVTIKQMFKAYLDYAEEKERAVKTIKTYSGQFNNYLHKFYGEADMVTVTREEHQGLLHFLKKAGVKPATRNRIRSLMSVLYSVAIRHRLFSGVFEKNPFESVGKSLEPKVSIEYLNPSEVEQLLNANRESHYYPLLLLMLNTGLRIGEALGIHSEQIDWMSGVLVIDRQYDDSQNRVVRRTKAKKQRAIYLIDEIRDILPRRIGPLFLKEDDTKLTSNYFRKFILPQACRLAEVKEIHPHGLRHTFAANYLMGNGSIWDLSKILGHHSVETTERYYAHFNFEHIKTRMRIIERKENVVRANFG